jgi:hypothetical protein
MFAMQNMMNTYYSHDLMMDTIDTVTDKRLQALRKIERDKARMAKLTTNG